MGCVAVLLFKRAGGLTLLLAYTQHDCENAPAALPYYSHAHSTTVPMRRCHAGLFRCLSCYVCHERGRSINFVVATAIHSCTPLTLDPFGAHALVRLSNQLSTSRAHCVRVCIFLWRCSMLFNFLPAQFEELAASTGSSTCNNPTTKKVQGVFDYCQQAFGTLHNRKECIIKFLPPAPGAIIPPQNCNA